MAKRKISPRAEATLRVLGNFIGELINPKTFQQQRSSMQRLQNQQKRAAETTVRESLAETPRGPYGGGLKYKDIFDLSKRRRLEYMEAQNRPSTLPAPPPGGYGSFVVPGRRIPTGAGL